LQKAAQDREDTQSQMSWSSLISDSTASYSVSKFVPIESEEPESVSIFRLDEASTVLTEINQVKNAVKMSLRIESTVLESSPVKFSQFNMAYYGFVTEGVLACDQGGQI
jgi:hypothetical protein